MQPIDAAKAARVWQRVQENTTPKEEGLLSMIAQEWSDAATYLQLSRRLQGKQSAAMRKMYEEEQSHTACLKGLYTLITGTRPAVKALPITADDLESLLRQCYRREMQSLAQYEQRSSDPEYGQVFSRLAAQEREHCRVILEVLGSLKKR